MWVRLGVPGFSIAQASHIRIVTEAALPMKIDGEPFMQEPSEIVIEFKNRASMIFNHSKAKNEC
jgi:hypothetical protein